MPADWGKVQQDALQAGYLLGQQILDDFIASAAPDASTNYWGIVNDVVGTYPNNALGYLFRSLGVVEGGVPNIALDAVYPTLVGNPSSFDGNHTYKLTFTVPSSNPTLPAVGIYPPMVSDSSGNPKGFWSIHVYATDPTQSAAPFIAQTSVLNTSYSTADTPVLSVDAATDLMTVKAPNWGTLVASTPILFGGNAAAYGLTPGTVYYVASVPTANADKTTYTFKISAQWQQELSDGPDGFVPIQGSGGNPGPDRRSAIARRRGRAQLRNGQAGHSARLVATRRQPIGQECRRVADHLVRPNATCRCTSVELDPNAVHGLLQRALPQYPDEHGVPVDTSHVLPDARKRAAVDPPVHSRGALRATYRRSSNWSP